VDSSKRGPTFLPGRADLPRRYPTKLGLALRDHGQELLD
jgi:hypothetical protein